MKLFFYLIFILSISCASTDKESLYGIDSDNDGIRDDVNELINSFEGISLPLKKAYEQYARAAQKMLYVYSDKQKSIEVGHERHAAFDCISIMHERGINELVKRKEAYDNEFYRDVHRQVKKHVQLFNKKGQLDPEVLKSAKHIKKIRKELHIKHNYAEKKLHQARNKKSKRRAQINSKTYNTKARLKAYLKADVNLAGEVFILSSDPNKRCEYIP